MLRRYYKAVLVIILAVTWLIFGQSTAVMADPLAREVLRDYDTQSVQGRLLQELHYGNGLRVEEKQHGIINFIRKHKAILTQDSNAAVAAIVMARREDDIRLALELAKEAINKGIATTRLIYELAFTLLLDGNCPAAKPIFLAFLDGRLSGRGWMITESRRAVLLCPDDHIWFYKFTYDFGHDENLAGTTPRQEVRPQQGSQISDVFLKLQQAYPSLDLPDSVTIGEPSVSGFWSRGNILAYHDLEIFPRRSSLTLSLSQKVTTPRGYEATNIASTYTTEKPLAKGVQTQQYNLYYQRQERGSDRPKTVNIGGSIFTAYEGQSCFPLRAGIALGQNQTEQSSTFSTLSQSFRLRLRNKPFDAECYPESARKPWWVELDITKATATIGTQSHRAQKLTSSLGPLSFGSLSPNILITLSGFYERRRQDEPVYWLAERQLSQHYHAKTTFHIRHIKTPYDVVLSFDDINSNNQVAHDQSASIFIRFLL